VSRWLEWLAAKIAGPSSGSSCSAPSTDGDATARTNGRVTPSTSAALVARARGARDQAVSYSAPTLRLGTGRSSPPGQVGARTTADSVPVAPAARLRARSTSRRARSGATFVEAVAPPAGLT
jgi:hypothetical protein